MALGRFRTDYAPTPEQMRNQYLQSQGRPVGSLGRQGARKTNDIIYALAEREKDPDIRAQLIKAIESGAFEQMSEGEASRAALQITSGKKAEGMNTEREGWLLQMLGREVGGIPADIAERYALDTSQPNGSRYDTAVSEALSRVGRARTGFEQQEMGAAQDAAARRGGRLSEGDTASIRNRGATLFGRQAGTEVGQLRREEEANRQQNVGRLSGALQNTTYTGGDYAGLAESSGYRGGAGTIGSTLAKKRAKYGGQRQYGISWKKAGTGSQQSGRYTY